MIRTNRTARSAAAALLAVSVVGCSVFEGRQTAGGYADDAEISTKVRTQLVSDQSFKGFNIGVETMDHVVQLSGFVDTDRQRLQAGKIAADIYGVKQVRNNIVIRNPSG